MVVATNLLPVTVTEATALQKIHKAEGDAAFDHAARQVLFATAALIASVRGRGRLTDLMEAIDEAIPQ